MLGLVPDIFNKKIVVGESSMGTYKNYPLKLPYLTVLVCLGGKAVVSVNFKNYMLKPNDILVLSEDSITVFLRTSKDFKLSYCLIEKSLAAEIAYNLPNQL